ncbi:serine hydrolase [Mammaliicoccus vitulinus]|nr:serine hydrolase [Mammaliicoccus vitulinus]
MILRFFNNINKSRYFTTGYFNTSFTSIESQPIDLDQYYGAGNLYMSTDDISKLMLKLKTKKIVNTETTNLLFNSHNRDIFPKNYRYGFYVYPTHNRIHGNFFGNDLVQYSNEKYVVTLASNYLPKPYNNQVEKHLKHIYIDILKQPYKQ